MDISQRENADTLPTLPSQKKIDAIAVAILPWHPYMYQLIPFLKHRHNTLKAPISSQQASKLVNVLLQLSMNVMTQLIHKKMDISQKENNDTGMTFLRLSSPLSKQVSYYLCLSWQPMLNTVNTLKAQTFHRKRTMLNSQLFQTRKIITYCLCLML